MLAKLLRARPTDPEKIEREIESLCATATEAAAELTRLEEAEREIEDAAEMAASMAATRALANRLRRLDGEIAAARERLKVARDEVREQLRLDLVAAFRPAAREFLAKAREAQAAYAAAVAAREAVGAAGFAMDYAELPVPPGIGGAALLAPDLLDQLAQAINPAPVRSKPASRIKAVPAPAPVATPAAEPVPAQAEQPAAPSPMRRRAPRRDVAGEGERRVHIMRGPIDHPRLGQLQGGDVVCMRPDEAEPLMRSGAADWISDEDVTSLDQSDAIPMKVIS